MKKVILSRGQKCGCGERDTVIFTLAVGVNNQNLVMRIDCRYGQDGFETTRVLPLDDAEEFRQRKLQSGFREGWGRF